MRASATLACMLATAASLVSALPTKREITATARSSAVEVAGSSGADDDDAIAYAWFAEDDGASEARGVRRGVGLSTSRTTAREVEVAGASGADDDDAIAYAWFAEDNVEDAAVRRDVEGAGASGADDDDAIAYAWFVEDEE